MLNSEAEQLATQLIAQYVPNYKFQWDRSVKRFGACHRGKRLITLSYDLTHWNSKEQVRDTILHEIAHALTPGHHHDDVWREMCIRIGAKPDRCYSSTTVEAVPSPWKGNCRCREYQRFKRPGAGRRYFCRSCADTVVFQYQGAFAK